MILDDKILFRHCTSKAYRTNVDWYHKIENKCGFMEWLNQAGIYGTNQKEFSDLEIAPQGGAPHAFTNNYVDPAVNYWICRIIQLFAKFITLY